MTVILSGCQEDTSPKNWLAYLDAFEPSLGEYLQTASYARSPDADTNDGYIQGKLVVVDVERRALDGLIHDLVELAAVSPEEVGTVVLLKTERTEVGSYTDGTKAYRWRFRISIVDLLDKRIVCERSFSGEPPPATKPAGGFGGQGDKPSAKVVSFLTSLPRK